MGAYAWLTLADIARRLDRPPATVYSWYRRGVLPLSGAHDLNGRPRWTDATIDEWYAEWPQIHRPRRPKPPAPTPTWENLT